MQTRDALVLHWCDDCAGVRAFEAPPCADGHDECPELACFECGAAIVVGGLSDSITGARRAAVVGDASSWALPRSA